ncbi:DUF445 domain-containing protein [Halalkalibacter krulwichiae]|uniref:DUF445 domain-containing protein n=1 Tax=Halalkalibacter krulwichiae TaxID=199441 RepID=A0A1X9MFC6_9BACI|nr:DUF445 family protein [Halalkalibacter krulwichiae]ARK29152.1 hypothetical protein BkAM31D_04380 [Halalkalibacter krulwichiae]
MTLQTLYLIGFMVLVGAIIGGLTNSLAIKMLFRPYREIKLGSWRVPFTPGLIPKRHEELAGQLGKMVVDYLITAEGLGKKLKNPVFTDGMTKWLRIEVEKILKSEKSAANLIEESIGLKQPKQIALAKTEELVQKSMSTFLTNNREKTLEQVLPETLLRKVDETLEPATTYILERGQAFIGSAEGKEKLSVMIDRFLIQKGTFGNMISMFLGNDRLVDKVQPELLRFLQDSGTKKLVFQLLEQEWVKVKQKQLKEVEEYLNEEELVSAIVRGLESNVAIFQWIDQPMKQWSGTYQETIMNTYIPKGVEVILDLLSSHLEELLKRFHLDEIVSEQVKGFSVERLEELVLSISKREFKMITYLGALLGGIIGFIQSLIVGIIG